MTMPTWGFALFCLVAFSGWMLVGSVWGMYRIEKRLHAEFRASWKKIADKYGIEQPEPTVRLVRPPPELKS